MTEKYYREITEEMLSFVDENPTAYHVVRNIENRLDDRGYVQLLEGDIWNLKKGDKYYVNRNGSSIIAFEIGQSVDASGDDTDFRIVATHSDSPSFKIKEISELTAGKKYTKLNVEGYGGMICSTWMDRPLSVAGRVVVEEKSEGKLISRLVDVDRDLVLIPSVAIHMNREANEGYKFNKQVDMLPLFATGDEKSNSLLSLIAKECDVERENILGADLFLYSREPSTVWGLDDEFVSSGRLDDQQCVFASLKALMDSKATQSINILACFDNEEVGSGTKQGADSTFLEDVMKRIVLSLGGSEEDYLRVVSRSFMLSADNAHAVHPNHPELTDSENCVYMNEGVVVKSHAAQKYTSDAMSIAKVKQLAKAAKVPLQFFANRSDKAGGSTLGNISTAHVSLSSVDIGLAQLAMHSAYETAGAKDTAYMIQLMKELYSY